MRTKTSCTAVVLLSVLAGGLRGQDLPHATMQHGAFAFPDTGGTRLLTVPDLPEPARIHAALCGVSRYSVRFERQQAARAESDHRQTWRNFDNVAGSVFSVLQGTIERDASCFLASDSLLASATVLAVERPATSTECNPEARQRLTTLRSRRVVNCWQLSRLPGGRSLLLAEFVRQDAAVLASTVVMDGDRAIFADTTATYKGPGQDLWRVDDGGVLTPDGMQLVFLIQRGTSYTLGLSWPGSEGTLLTGLASDGGDRFTRVIGDYWYRAPK